MSAARKEGAPAPVEVQPITMRFVGLSVGLVLPFIVGGIHATGVLSDIKTEIALMRKDMVTQAERVTANTSAANAKVSRREMAQWVEAFKQLNPGTVEVPAFRE